MNKAEIVFNKLSQMRRPTPATPPWHIGGFKKTQTSWQMPSPLIAGKTRLGGRAFQASRNIKAYNQTRPVSTENKIKLQNLLNK